MKIYVNGRFRAHKITGVQRYAHEVTSRLQSDLQVCEPTTRLRGWRGHLWEQTILPLESRTGLLWNPCASGPLNVRNQVVTFHDLFPLDSPEWYSKMYVMWYRFLMSRLAQTALKLIAVSEYTKNRVSDLFQIDPKKISVIPNGVAESFFTVSAPQAEAAKTALRLPSNSYLLSVGSLEPRKNLQRLLAAWSQVVDELPSDFWLVLAGSSDPNVYRFAGLDKLPPRVHLTGYVPDAHLGGLYSGSSGFLYPSLGEGFGLPVLEAMACSVPVLTSRRTALPEVCANNAVYVDPSDTLSIAEGIVHLATDSELRRNLAANGRLRAQLFTWDRTARETLHVLSVAANSSL